MREAAPPSLEAEAEELRLLLLLVVLPPPVLPVLQ
jgi:hypothetical protein